MALAQGEGQVEQGLAFRRASVLGQGGAARDKPSGQDVKREQGVERQAFHHRIIATGKGAVTASASGVNRVDAQKTPTGLAKAIDRSDPVDNVGNNTRREVVMAEVHYGVVRVGETWAIIGDQLRVGAYTTRRQAETAARRLAEQVTGVGLPVRMHLQDDTGQLHKPTLLS
ncbi:hypothetical protein GCM10010983_31260 [Caulobacter rhizosphaerae]|nr:hypothetical protein GCM10010983_31260 [Caulobacter rhizosphaerae]